MGKTSRCNGMGSLTDLQASNIRGSQIFSTTTGSVCVQKLPDTELRALTVGRALGMGLEQREALSAKSAETAASAFPPRKEKILRAKAGALLKGEEGGQHLRPSPEVTSTKTKSSVTVFRGI